MQLRLIALLLATIVCLSHGLEADLSSNAKGATSWQDVVKIQSGYIHGRITPFNTREFLGIPFAAPPLGSLRWQPPTAVQPWGEKIIDASVLKPACAQLPDPYSSEDCLYLNVYAPLQPHDPISPFPVMVFIHGGSYTDGSAKVDTYNATRMVAANGNVVVVTIQYRLNAFGFLGSQVLLGSDKSTGNWGLQDQRFALKWVRDNIAAFWGDATNITVFGESAGSGSISAHLVMPLSTGIFDRAILESGPFSNWIAKPLWQANNTFVQLANFLGCNHDATTCLRGKSTQDLLKGVAYLAANPPADANEIRWSAVIDFVELVDHPKVLAKQGKFANSVPVILGANRDEGTIFLQNVIPRNITELQYGFLLSRYFGANATDVANHYPISQYENAWWALAHAYGDAAFNCPARRSARWLAAAVPSVYFYFFTHAPTFPPIASLNIGAFHSAELMFVFRDPNMLYGQQEYTLADSMIGYWTQFARKSDPNHGSAVQWPPYLLETDDNIVLDTTITSQTGLKQALCDFWDQTSF